MEDLVKMQLFFQNLSDLNRLKIIQVIGEKDCSVSEIVEATGLSQPLVSHHLRTLRENLILETNRAGPFVYYKIKDQKLLSALGILLDIVISQDDIKDKSSIFNCPSWWNMHWNKNE